MQNVISKLEKNQTFRFSCSPQVPCFNACCRDLNQVLTPYDVLCLKQSLKMTSTDFLQTYTRTSTGPGTGLPVVSLRFDETRDLACPFVTPEGCRVYPARPASCRTYPLARGVSPRPANGSADRTLGLDSRAALQGIRGGAVHHRRPVGGRPADHRPQPHERPHAGTDRAEEPSSPGGVASIRRKARNHSPLRPGCLPRPNRSGDGRHVCRQSSGAGFFRRRRIALFRHGLGSADSI